MGTVPLRLIVVNFVLLQNMHIVIGAVDLIFVSCLDFVISITFKIL